MEEFTKKDFEKVNFKPSDIDAGTHIFRRFPVLSLHPEMKVKLKAVSFYKVIKYIFFLYQINSPFLSISNLKKRKITAAIQADFGRDSEGEFTEPYLNMLLGKNSDFNMMALCFCRIQKSTVFSRLVVFHEALYSELQIMKGFENDKEMKPADKKIIRENIQSLSTDIENLTQELLFEDDNKYLVSEVFEEIEMENLALKPEDIAAKLRSGENPVMIFPYGKDYKPPRIRYAQVPVK